MSRRDTILIVDDIETNRVILRELLKDSYKIIEAESGEEALYILSEKGEEIVLILLDIVMPEINGFQMIRILKDQNILVNIPVVFITACDSEDYEEEGHKLGASDIIKKPFNPYIIKRRINNLVELYNHKNELEELVEVQVNMIKEQNEKLMKQAERINSINNNMIDILGTIIEYRDMESGKHIKRIRYFTYELLKVISEKYPEYELTDELIEMISSAATMHDIGKIAIPDSILLKPGKLTKEEFEIMKTHSIKGCEILNLLDKIEDNEYLNYCYDICHYHHEKWDGNGYPKGLKGDEIPLCAQVVSIADCYDALTTKRSYKKAFSHEKAVNMIMKDECGVFSPRLKECFTLIALKFKELATLYSDIS
ncbi:HD-GYP domain-containing protein [Clostridium paraputrificum]|uniref:HD-GYP domain-containing protein n=1 Tax=Clostridium paraputrificum TaxID=29363 RepID=UPI003D332C51